MYRKDGIPVILPHSLSTRPREGVKRICGNQICLGGGVKWCYLSYTPFTVYKDANFKQ
jgi:hypothetical protein